MQDVDVVLIYIVIVACYHVCTGMHMPKECDLQVFCCFVSYCMNAQSRVSAEKKDYYDSKLMLHWSYICTSAGCFLGGIFMLCGGVLLVQLYGVLEYNAINHNH